MKLVGCLLLLGLILVWAAVEGTGLWLLASSLGAGIGDGWTHPEWLGALLLTAICSVVGVVIIKRQAAALPQELVGSFMGMPGKGLGRRVVAILGGILLAIPGPATDVLGILLLLPPVQMLLAALAARIAMSVAKQTMGKMMAGGGLFGGAGGAAGGRSPFPGMMPFPGLKPDDSAPRRPKTYEVEAERDR
jgi:UPF0716 family protein affecting phage T7 exclusion